MTLDLHRLDVQADLQIRHETGIVRLRGARDMLDCEISGWRVLWSLLRTARRLPANPASLDRGLRHADLSVAFLLRGRRIGGVGKGARPGLLERWLGLGPVDLHFRKLALALAPRVAGTRPS